MDPDITVTGTVGSNWSIYRFQAVEASSYSSDYRFSPSDNDVQPWIYQRQSDVHTFYAGATSFQLQGAFEAFS